MRILALDCGTKTGWALAEAGRVSESGVQTFDLQRGESPGMRFLRFRGWLARVWALTPPELVYYEQAHHRSGAATMVGVAFATRVQEWAAEHEIDCLPVHTATLKKFATGSGRANKSAMIAVATTDARGGRKPDLTDDEADAIILAIYA